MISLPYYGQISTTLKCAKNTLSPMGGVNTILGGDLEQFRPIANQAVFETPNGKYQQLSTEGTVAFNSISHVIFLDQETPRFDEEYGKFMKNLYEYKSTFEDVAKLKSRVITKDLDPTDYVFITPRNSNRIAWNYKVAELYRNSNTVSYDFDANDKFEGKPITGKTANFLNQFEIDNKYPGKLTVWVGAKVLVTSKRYRKIGITYGSFGVVSKVYSEKGVPNCILVSFENLKYNLKGVKNDPNTGTLAFYPEKFSTKLPGREMSKKTNKKRDINISREQFGLQLCYAISDIKSQSKTFKKVIVDLVRPSGHVNHESLYVMLSRNVSWDNLLIFSDFDENLILQRKQRDDLIPVFNEFKTKAVETQLLFTNNTIRSSFTRTTKTFSKQPSIPLPSSNQSISKTIIIRQPIPIYKNKKSISIIQNPQPGQQLQSVALTRWRNNSCWFDMVYEYLFERYSTNQFNCDLQFVHNTIIKSLILSFNERQNNIHRKQIIKERMYGVMQQFLRNQPTITNYSLGGFYSTDWIYDIYRLTETNTTDKSIISNFSCSNISCSEHVIREEIFKRDMTTRINPVCHRCHTSLNCPNIITTTNRMQEIQKSEYLNFSISDSNYELGLIVIFVNPAHFNGYIKIANNWYFYDSIVSEIGIFKTKQSKVENTK